MDVARTALRNGSRRVMLFSRDNTIDASSNEVDYARQLALTRKTDEFPDETYNSINICRECIRSGTRICCTLNYTVYASLLHCPWWHITWWVSEWSVQIRENLNKLKSLRWWIIPTEALLVIRSPDDVSSCGTIKKENIQQCRGIIHYSFFTDIEWNVETHGFPPFWLLKLINSL